VAVVGVVVAPTAMMTGVTVAGTADVWSNH
jgi:hypothetical protein